MSGPTISAAALARAVRALQAVADAPIGAIVTDHRLECIQASFPLQRALAALPVDVVAEKSAEGIAA